MTLPMGFVTLRDVGRPNAQPSIWNLGTRTHRDQRRSLWNAITTRLTCERWRGTHSPAYTDM